MSAELLHEPLLSGPTLVFDAADDDVQLLALSRDGDAEAFAELFRRYRPVAVRIAARTSRSIDPNDAASEAFLRVWRALRNGGGPDRYFKPYLARTVRNLTLTMVRTSREQPTDTQVLEQTLEATSQGPGPDSQEAAIAEAAKVVSAFGELPERWRNALWATEVEGRSVAEYAESIGTTPNTAAALCMRAREGLKSAWLQVHVAETPDANSECRWTLERLGAYERKRLSTVQSARVAAHLDGCDTCGRSARRLAFIGTSLKVSTAFAGTGATFMAIKAAGITSGGAGGVAAVATIKPQVVVLASMLQAPRHLLGAVTGSARSVVRAAAKAPRVLAVASAAAVTVALAGVAVAGTLGTARSGNNETASQAAAMIQAPITTPANVTLAPLAPPPSEEPPVDVKPETTKPKPKPTRTPVTTPRKKVKAKAHKSHTVKPTEPPRPLPIDVTPTLPLPGTPGDTVPIPTLPPTVFEEDPPPATASTSDDATTPPSAAPTETAPAERPASGTSHPAPAEDEADHEAAASSPSASPPHRHHHAAGHTLTSFPH